MNGVITMSDNAEYKVIQGFGEEWSEFDQSDVSDAEMDKIFNGYFSIIDWSKIKTDSVCFDLGCGSGRWANLVSKRVGKLHCIDPSEAALEVAKKNCALAKNCTFHLATVDNIPLDDESCDFGYSLGVLHHVPDTASGIASCVKKIKKGSPFLIYLYYAFDNRAGWFKVLWKSTEVVRFIVSRSPYRIRYFITQLIALAIYLPLARLSLLMEKLGAEVDSYPLSAYRDKSLYIMRNDALDRFGTKLEQRFTRKEIEEMMIAAGLQDITFNKEAPYWCAVGYRK
jgi:ubiquinone/menaquinone biosynthesis C-methylase UbiE